jgi:hypothetical protein
MPDTPVSHDQLCPKSFPPRAFIDVETGDFWVLGPTKFLCQCTQLEEECETGDTSLQTKLTDTRKYMESGDFDVPEHLRDIQTVLDVAVKVMGEEEIRNWMGVQNPELEDMTPLEVIAEGNRQRIVDLLTALAEGLTN